MSEREAIHSVLSNAVEQRMILHSCQPKPVRLIVDDVLAALHASGFKIVREVEAEIEKDLWSCPFCGGKAKYVGEEGSSPFLTLCAKHGLPRRLKRRCWQPILLP